MYSTNSLLVFIALSALAKAANYPYGTCNAGGKSGVCISTGTCTSGGGHHTAGLCPGDSSIQCCTYGTCDKKGTAGICETTSSCKGTSTPGLCPGPADIQCCTTSKSPPNSGGSCPPLLNKAAIDLVKSSEGWAASPYTDATGNPTIGYGHLCDRAHCTELGYQYTISIAEGEKLLQKDLKRYETCLASAIKVKLNANQYGALTSWTFNMGCGAMQESTLVKRLNRGENADIVAKEELPKWVHGGKRVLPGLVKRRAAEIKLFQTDTGVGDSSLLKDSRILCIGFS